MVDSILACRIADHLRQKNPKGLQGPGRQSRLSVSSFTTSSTNMSSDHRGRNIKRPSKIGRPRSVLSAPPRLTPCKQQRFLLREHPAEIEEHQQALCPVDDTVDELLVHPSAHRAWWRLHLAGGDADHFRYRIDYESGQFAADIHDNDAGLAAVVRLTQAESLP